MDTHGKKTSVVIQEMSGPNHIFVYADEDTQAIISNIAGVLQISKQAKDTFSVWLDPRFDYEFVKAEIIAAIKIAKE